MTQLFRTTDVLSLEVEGDWPHMPNLVPNPTGGDFGAYGWVAVELDDDNHFAVTLEFPLDGGIVDGTIVSAETDPLPLPSDHSDLELRIAAEVLTVTGIDGTSCRVSVAAVYYDAAGAEVAVSPRAVGTTTGPYTTGNSLAYDPGVAWWAVRVGIEVLDAAAVDETAAITFTGVVAIAGTAAQIVGTPLDVEPDYFEILHVATTVATDRIPMDVATLTASLVIDPDGPRRLSPGEPLLPDVDADKIRKGKQVRLRAMVSDNTTPTKRDSYLFRGWIGEPQTTLDVTSKPRAVAKVTFTAVDVVSVLAGVTRPDGPNSLAALIPLVLTGAGVPYDVESATGPGPQQLTPAVPVAYVQDATAVDQIVVTRDTYLAYAWATAAGVLKVRTAFTLGDDVTGSFDEHFYNGGGPVIGYDLTDVVNSVTVKLRGIVDGNTTETVYGPFEDLDSIREYSGRVTKEVTIQGDPSDWLPPDPDDPAELEAYPIGQYARAVLAANAYTSKRITAVTAAVAALEDLAAAGAAHHDLYELVTATSVRGGFADPQPSRITRVAHTIVPGKWLVTYGLVDVGRVARYQKTRALR